MPDFGISRERALCWIVTKQIPAYEIEKKWKLKLSEIDELVSSKLSESIKVGHNIVVTMFWERLKDNEILLMKKIKRMII